MKNAMNYYYNLITYDIHRIGSKYTFSVDKDKYLLCLCDLGLEEVEEIYKLNAFLLQMNVYNHQIILNNSNKIITYINNEPYILMRIFILENRKITTDDIVLFNNLPMYEYFSKLRKTNWRNFWIQKIDYFEYQVSQFGNKHRLIKESFSYFVGLVETAILLLYDFNPQSNLIIAHRRITYTSTLQDLYNPLNLIVDTRVRDMAEYFKSIFFKVDNILNEIKIYIQKSSLTEEELYLFFVRMCYPTFYFDLYEEIISGNKADKELLYIINKIDDYQKLLKDLYWFLKPIVNIPDIEWIIKT